jgi:hypothetical protein
VAARKEIPPNHPKSPFSSKEQAMVEAGAQDAEEGLASAHALRWGASFPYLIYPLPEEWLPGLLLRCDTINEWPYGTTLRLVYDRAGKKVVARDINFCAPKQFPFDVLADGLGVPTTVVTATTYLDELTRLFPQSRPHPAQLGPFIRRSYPICPLCIRQGMLYRSWCLPGLTLCSQDGTVLQYRCSCQWGSTWNTTR